MRRVPESNRRIEVLQTPALPLRQRANSIPKYTKNDQGLKGLGFLKRIAVNRSEVGVGKVAKRVVLAENFRG